MAKPLFKKGNSIHHQLPSELTDPEAIRAYYQNIISYMPNNVYWLDRNCITQGCNENVLKLVGLKSLDEFVGITYEEMGRLAGWTAGQAESFKRDDMEVMSTGIAKYNIEEPPLYDGSGNPIYYMSSRVPLFNDKGEVIGVIGISVDITERKKNEQALQVALEKAEAANRAKTSFLANLSHDLKTPLAGIISSAEFLKLAIENPEDQKRADNIFKSGLRLLDLIVELIEISRLGINGNSDDRIRFKLEQLIEDLIQLVIPALEDKGLTIDFKYDHKIPKFLIGNHSYVYRILLNLISNAIKFTDKGGITIKIEIAEKTKKNIKLKISVKDTGAGIPKDKQKVIFEQFTRLSPSFEGNYTGSGLGLYIVKEFINAMKGEIYVDSSPGKGSTFTCLIPLEEAELQTEDENTSKKEELKPSSQRSSVIPFAPKANIQTETKKSSSLMNEGTPKAKILLVEDDLIAGQVAKDVVQSFGYDVDIAKTGKIAFDIFQQSDYNLILMDLGLPDISGIEVTKMIRKAQENLTKKTPIIALSAHIDPDMQKACFEVGMDGVLPKPLLRDQAEKIFNEHVKVVIKNDEPSSSKEMKIIDLELGASIINSDVDAAKEMLKIFMEELPKKKQEIEQAFQLKDIQKLIKLVHQMHGGLCYCGAPRLKEAAQKLEITLKSNSQEKLDSLYNNFYSELELFAKAYEDL